VRDTAAKRPEIKEFVQFMLTHADLVSEVGYLPLPKSAYDLAWQHYQAGKLGTVFAGVPKIGITIEQLQAMEGKL
jgi:phosphate transport system substrate-binding protein